MFMNVFEPVTLLSTLASRTRLIGLGGTVSTVTEPYMSPAVSLRSII